MKKFIIFLLLLSMCGDTSTSEVESTSENNEVIESLEKVGFKMKGPSF